MLKTINKLRAARMMAGFRSARAAALAHSWPLSLYAAHESGSRHPDSSKMQEYLRAFGVASDDLDEVFNSPWPIRSEKLRGNPTFQQRSLRKSAGRRLGLVRRLAGFETAGEAAAEFGWKSQSYYAHESGRHAMSDTVAAYYGKAFGAVPAWIQRGEEPSDLGLPNEMERIVATFISGGGDHLPHELLPFVSSSRRGSKSDVDALRSAQLATTALAKAKDAFGHVLDVVPEGGNTPSGAAWGFPEGFLKSVWGVQSVNLAVIPVSPSADWPDARPGDRALIDRDVLSGGSGAQFAVRFESGEISLTRGSTVTGNATVVGRVIARFERPQLDQ